KQVEEALNRLEQGLEKIAEVFDQYTETVRQEIAFINQRIMDLESKIETTTNWSSFSIGETARTKPTPPASKSPPIETSISREKEYTPAKSYTAPPPQEAEITASRRPSQIRPPTRRGAEPASLVTREDIGIGGSSEAEGFGGYRPMRGGIVEEKYVRPSVFSREMSKLEAAAAAAPQAQYGPGGYPLPPSMQLRAQISTVLGKIKPEAQRRAPRPEPTAAYAAAPSYQAPRRPPVEEEYAAAPSYQAPRRPPVEEEYGSPQPAYVQAPPPPDSSGEAKSIRVPDNWLPDSCRAKYYNPKQLKKGDLKEMEKKTKDIFK
ncbi:MAG: hypothetical protein QXV37_02990, partial [Candidatus Jordarchaeaceae archaeon]